MSGAHKPVRSTSNSLVVLSDRFQPNDCISVKLTGDGYTVSGVSASNSHTTGQYDITLTDPYYTITSADVRIHAQSDQALQSGVETIAIGTTPLGGTTGRTVRVRLFKKSDLTSVDAIDGDYVGFIICAKDGR